MKFVEELPPGFDMHSALGEHAAKFINTTAAQEYGQLCDIAEVSEAAGDLDKFWERFGIRSQGEFVPVFRVDDRGQWREPVAAGAMIREDNTLRLENLVTHPDYRNRKIASAVLTVLVNDAEVYWGARALDIPQPVLDRGPDWFAKKLSGLGFMASLNYGLTLLLPGKIIDLFHHADKIDEIRAKMPDNWYGVLRYYLREKDEIVSEFFRQSEPIGILNGSGLHDADRNLVAERVPGPFRETSSVTILRQRGFIPTELY